MKLLVLGNSGMKIMKKYKLTRNPYFLFFPFLLFFIVFVILFHSDVMTGDDSRYLMFAQNLLHGFYSPSAPDINLWNGPGYPIILMPFVAMRLPLISITLLNTVFQYLAIVLLFKAMIQLVPFRKALLFSFFLAICYSSYSFLARILTESFTLFLISLLIFSIVNAFYNRKNKYLYLSGFLLGYIALTKVIFGYVILFLLLGSILLWLTNRKANNYRTSVFILLIAFATVTPYLFYTYNLTGRLFYWSNSGGMSLYWMSTPYENEYGDWNNESFNFNHIDAEIAGITGLIKSSHQKDMDEVLKYKGVEKEDAYKRIAINNIKTYPKKYIKNIAANISRLLFGFPGTYTFQRPMLKIWYFSALYTLMLFCFIPTVIKWREISYSIRFLLFFTFIYLGVSSLVSVDNRQFVIIVPILLFWIADIINKTITIKIK